MRWAFLGLLLVGCGGSPADAFSGPLAASGAGAGSSGAAGALMGGASGQSGAPGTAGASGTASGGAGAAGIGGAGAGGSAGSDAGAAGQGGSSGALAGSGGKAGSGGAAGSAGGAAGGPACPTPCGPGQTCQAGLCRAECSPACTALQYCSFAGDCLPLKTPGTCSSTEGATGYVCVDAPGSRFWCADPPAPDAGCKLESSSGCWKCNGA